MAVFSALGTIEVCHELCHGCRSCEIACSIRHEGAVNPEASRIRVYQFDPGPLDIPVLCRQCSDYPCVAACPPGARALEVDGNTGAVLVDGEKCLGEKCGRCAGACRQHSAIFYHPVTGRAVVCDLCGGKPECVKVCPTGALAFVPGSSFDGRHSACTPPKELAEDLFAKIFGQDAG